MGEPETTWSESVAGPAFVGYEVVADQGVPGRFYTGAQGGRLWRSDDGGFTFTSVFEDPVVSDAREQERRSPVPELNVSKSISVILWNGI